eukprot:CAMPEP_0206487768 /NCGR_PEP_ID=MMETSP0324_2-20121206/41892_1 /ASSEMBLY_ACC=CAM_ASM_000836 /TAXON_ID=2866 /ORGANISM="Crypthecodinium cohnii, Strain Seligo" /LENGTH=338 /DNA_ID=CAMNT_0053966421 /DNA_START=283 /DNA_END=1295 /DNA_ORIENTATION=-
MAHPSEMHPLLKRRLEEPKTVFFPGHRIRMNVVPMFLNVLVPWAAFMICCALTSFWLLYTESRLVLTVLALVFALCFAMFALALAARKASAEPTWFSYIAIVTLIGAVAGTGCGVKNYFSYSRPYYAIKDLKVAHQVDAGRELGQDLMDAGILYFAKNNRLDHTRSWHFKHGTIYCVAPVTTNHSKPLTNSYDFWAVGEDCCSTGTSDFRCGADWATVNTRSAIRILDSEDDMYYRLAVQQAEALYDISSGHPIFFRWIKDPLAEINRWRAQAFKNFLVLVSMAFCFSLAGVTIATCGFAWLGRAKSAYATDFYSESDYKSLHMKQAGPAHGTRALSP